MSAIITLTTDFGLDDAYVAAMKGVILGINPEVRLVDICHTVRPQNISQAAFILSTAYPCFPSGTIHLAVIDPGVGSKRQAIILRTPSAYFVAPDNGVLSYVVDEYITDKVKMEIISITNPRFWRSPVSTTFHGRDIFAPVAAYLSLGHQLSEFGESIATISTFPIIRPQEKSNGSMAGSILHIDSFGNLITNIRNQDLPEKAGTLVIEIRGRKITGLSGSYTESEGLIILTGSSGYLEISVKNGSAQDILCAKVGDELTVQNVVSDKQ